jgi:hypothetical protein
VAGYVVLAVALVCACIAIHYEAMQWTALKLLPRIHFLPTRSLVLVGVLVCMIAHLVEVVMFGAVLYAMDGVGGDLGDPGPARFGFLNYVNASVEAYTSLGYAKTELTQAHRLISGAEALTGLVMIAWTASFTYLLMDRYWRQRHGWN